MANELGEWIQQEINRRGWSQRELGRQANLSQSVVNGVLAGERNPSADFCMKVAHALEVSPIVVLVKAGILTPQALDEDSAITEITERVRTLSPEQRQQVLDFITFITHYKK